MKTNFSIKQEEWKPPWYTEGRSASNKKPRPFLNLMLLHCFKKSQLLDLHWDRRYMYTVCLVRTIVKNQFQIIYLINRFYGTFLIFLLLSNTTILQSNADETARTDVYNDSERKQQQIHLKQKHSDKKPRRSAYDSRHFPQSTEVSVPCVWCFCKAAK
jgi:hypothetical protein